MFGCEHLTYFHWFRNEYPTHFQHDLRNKHTICNTKSVVLMFRFCYSRIRTCYRWTRSSETKHLRLNLRNEEVSVKPIQMKSERKSSLKTIERVCPVPKPWHRRSVTWDLMTTKFETHCSLLCMYYVLWIGVSTKTIVYKWGMWWKVKRGRGWFWVSLYSKWCL